MGVDMSDKSLKDKAIQIQGKDYVLVSDRIIFFNENYPDGSIETDLVTDPLSDIIVVKATIYPNGKATSSTDTLLIERKFTGYSQAVKGAGFINKTAALENAETSAVGRALAMMGIGVIDSVASVYEIEKAKGIEKNKELNKPTNEQKVEIMELTKQAGIKPPTADDSREFADFSSSVIDVPFPNN